MPNAIKIELGLDDDGTVIVSNVEYYVNTSKETITLNDGDSLDHLFLQNIADVVSAATDNVVFG